MPITGTKVNVRRSRLNISAQGLVIGAIAVSVGLASCTGSRTPDSFESADSGGRMHAAVHAVAIGDAATVSYLVDMLTSDDPAERLVAIGSLERLTGQRLDYDPVGGASGRRAAIVRWRAWVANRSGAVNDPATVTGVKTDR